MCWAIRPAPTCRPRSTASTPPTPTIKAQLVAADLNAIGADPNLSAFAERAGAAVFRTNCAQCHGSGAAGLQGKGYPNLLDDDWLWGGTMEDIHLTITHGIRNTTDPDARYSRDADLRRGRIAGAGRRSTRWCEHVLAISGQEHDAALAAAGATVCSPTTARPAIGKTARATATQGAPNLTDAIWLYGGDARRDAPIPSYICPLWRDAELEHPADRGRDPRGGVLCPRPGRRRVDRSSRRTRGGPVAPDPFQSRPRRCAAMPHSVRGQSASIDAGQGCKGECPTAGAARRKRQEFQ